MIELIEKYFNNNLTDSELLELTDYLKKEEHQELFKAYVKYHYDLDLQLQQIDTDLEFSRINKHIKKETKLYKKSLKQGYRLWYKVAAVFVGVIGLSYAFYLFSSGSGNQVVVDANSITLTLDNGDVKVINEDGSEKIINKKGHVVGKQEGTKLDYKTANNTNNNKEGELVFNELYVPHGKKVQITLSDGTLVYLNAGSTLKYPVKFIKGSKRDVFLNGEAYFDVIKNKSQPFVVNMEDVNIQVLGTKFNVNSYKEDKTMNTVLVEGSVALYKNQESFNPKTAMMLTPGNLASWNKVGKQMQVSKVDTYEYTAWTDGVLLFKIRPFSEIIKVLERHYNITITNNYKYLNNLRFFARFDVETIDQVLKSFQNSEAFSYQIQGNNIIINNP